MNIPVEKRREVDMMSLQVFDSLLRIPLNMHFNLDAEYKSCLLEKDEVSI